MNIANKILNFNKNKSKFLLDKKFLLKNKFLVYGLGSGFYTFKSYVLDKIKYKINYSVFDLVKQNHQNAISLDKLKLISKKTLIIICVGKKYIREVKIFLKKLGFLNFISPYNFYEYQMCYDKLQNNKFKLLFKNNSKKVNKIYELLYDNLSKKIFSEYYQILYNKINIPINKSPFSKIYSDIDIKLFSNKKKSYSILNVGSYDGDVILNLLKKKVKIKDLYCFEPNLQNYKKLLKNIHKNKNKISGKIFLYPAGCSDTNTFCRFNTNQRMLSRFTNEKKFLFSQIVKLDNFINFNKIDYVIADIEGFEKKFIDGYKSTISKFKPNFIIAGYHYAFDLIDIILKLYKLNNKYKFFIRNFSGHTSETIIYATT
jgi:FkbM family methyltransferase